MSHPAASSARQIVSVRISHARRRIIGPHTNWASWLAITVVALLDSGPLRSQTLPPAAAATPAGTVATQVMQGTGAAAPLERLVSLNLHNVSLREALDEIDRQAHLGLTYSTRVVPVNKSVTITTAHVTAGEALSRVLTGTGVHAVATPANTVMLLLSEIPVADTAVDGIVWGRVADSLTDKPLVGAVVDVKGSRLAASSNEHGLFYIRHVPAGVQEITVREVGFIPIEREVAIAGGQEVRLDLKLQMTMTRLQEVVTTATGKQRRLELGNDITAINADSVVATQPVSSVTDLLENRVPGLTVQRTSGAPGDPARLRLRGVGSIALSSDPIVIVDGVRVNSAVSDERSLNFATPLRYSTPSVLDEIDVHSIDRIEVFKGPSATSMYGPDAAGGVIVITTKHGQAGPPRWTTNIDHGLSYVPGKYAPSYLQWGHSPRSNAPILCPIQSETCLPDSLVTFQALNDPSTSPLGRGGNTAGTIGVSGGFGGLSYSVNGHYRQESGTTHLPAFEIAQYESAQGAAPPEWMQHPDNLTEWGGTAQLSSQIGSKATVSITSMLTHQEQQRSNLDGQIGAMMQTYVDRATGAYYLVGAGALASDQSLYTAYNTRVTDASTAYTGALSLEWHPAQWLTTSTNAGLNLIDRIDDALEPPGTVPTSDTLGYIGTGSGTALESTLNLQATAAFDQLPLGVAMQLAVGANYNSSSTADDAVHGTGLPQGATSVAQAARIDGSQNSSDLRSFGLYITPSFHRNGLWLDSGLRLDGGSSYGSSVSLVAFPKLSLSYLVSSESWFPNRLHSLFDDLRLRLAYGQAGRVPTPSDRLRLYQLNSTVLDGSTVDVATLSDLGNDSLRPERSGEFESGFDTDLLNGRLSVSFTGYRKLTRDAILSIPVAPSVYGNASILRNVGTIRNTGFDVSLGADIMRGALVHWREQVTISHNANVLVSLNHADSTQGLAGLMLKPGYPVDGLWAYPLLGYADRNGDGRIESNELLIGDSLAYMGSPSPSYTGSLQSIVGFLHDAISIDVGVSYEAGFTQSNGQFSYGISRGYNDPSAPLSEQALAASFLATGLGSLPPGSGLYGQYQQVSVLRLNSLAVTWRLPQSAVQWLGSRALTVSLQGTNLWLRTTYRGKDPDVNSPDGLSNGFVLSDGGVLPQPRTWQLRVSAAY